MMGRFTFRWYPLVTLSVEIQQKLFETLALDYAINIQRFARLCCDLPLHPYLWDCHVCIASLQSSRWEDLAVGAPQFYEKDGLTGGAVYIYINNGGKYWKNIDPVRLNGSKESMFGLAVENIGDLNQDSYGGKMKAEDAWMYQRNNNDNEQLCLLKSSHLYQWMWGFWHHNVSNIGRCCCWCTVWWFR